MTKVCRHCGDEFELRPGKPGLIDECPLHAHDGVEKVGGNMIYEHKTAPYIEIKSMASAKRFAALTSRWGAGVTKSLTQSREPHMKDDESAVEGATYSSKLGEKRSVKGGSQQ